MDNIPLAESKTSLPNGGTQKVWKVLTAFGIALGTIAVALSTASLVLILLQYYNGPLASSTNHKSESERSGFEPFRTAEENERMVSDVLYKKHFHGHRNQRSAGFTCLDYSEEQKNKTPTAHITGTVGYREFGFEGNRIEILSDGWLCANPLTKAHVAGGMTFKDGFLKVPRDGVYFIYSQVSLEVKNTSEATGTSKPILMGHSTIICECSDRELLGKSCECFAEEKPSQKFSSVKNYPYLQSKSENIGKLKGSHFHGGLFHLSADSYISIIPIVPKPENSETKIFAQYLNSFFGAFLVSSN